MTLFDRAREALARAVASTQSSFYRDLYASKGFDVSRLPAHASEWSLIPPLSKADIINIPVKDRLFVPLAEVGQIRFTSGTTGGVLIMPRRLQPPAPANAPIYPGSVLMSFFNAYAMFCVRGEAKQRIIAGDVLRLAESAVLAAEAGVDMLNGPASLLIAFAQHLRRHGAHINIRTLTLTSEQVTALQLNALRELYPNASLTSIFGMREVGELAHTPPHMKDTMLVRALTGFYIELIGEDGAHPLDEISKVLEGNLIVTSCNPDEVFPLIRYRTGDRARAVRTDGMTLFEVIGRAEEERVRIFGGEIILTELERAIGKAVGSRAVDFECVVGEERRGESLVTTLALTLYASDDERAAIPDAAGQIADLLRVNQLRTYADGVARGIYAPIECVFANLQSTGKKRRHLTDTRS